MRTMPGGHRLTFQDMAHWSQATGSVLAEWEALALTDMGEALIRASNDKVETELHPPLTMSTFDELFGEKRG